MARKRGKSVTEKIAYVLSAIVALSMLLGLLGPILIKEPTYPTPTWPPTWTPPPTWTQPPATATPMPTIAQTPTLGAMSVPLPPRPQDLPVVEPGKAWTFAVAGDNRHDTDIYQQLLERVVQDGNAFLINTGDLVDYGNKKNFQAFQQLMVDFPLPFYPVPGNHDLDDDGLLTHYLAFSGAPAAHYSFDVDMVHFTLSNSASGHLSQTALDWIDQDLAATDRPAKIVVTHYPPFDPDETGHILFSGNEAFMALMEKHQVAHVFTGHIHAYSQEERNGTVYTITGGAGSDLYVDDHPDAFYHYVQVTVDGDQVQTEVIPLQ
jgi:hypothetical protein